MSNHIAGNWFISVFKMRVMRTADLIKVAQSPHYRETTRHNALVELDNRKSTI